MLLIRDIMYCKPGKVRPMVERDSRWQSSAKRREWEKCASSPT